MFGEIKRYKSPIRIRIDILPVLHTFTESSQARDVYNRPISFQFGSTACCKVMSRYFTMTGLQILPDKMLIVQDKTGSDCQDVERQAEPWVGSRFDQHV